jgi:hypothetical protein
VLSKLDIKEAINKLSRNKAKGVDGLKDIQIRAASKKDQVLQKITNCFNEWLQNNHNPNYLKRARVVPLSKENTKYPQTGNIRPIAIYPSVTKLFEQAILLHLEQELEKVGGLNQAQHGFRKGRNIFQNLNKVGNFLKQAILEAENDRRNKVKIKDRECKFALFLDLQKAFDCVCRDKLLVKMHRMGLNASVINAVAVCLSNTSHNITD